MRFREARPLEREYKVEVDLVDEQEWYNALQLFDDANLYQTWAYGTVMSGRSNISHLVLRRQGAVVAVAQARIAKIPVIPAGMAYILWGPVWRRRGAGDATDAFQQMVRALRNEFVCKRGLTLRLSPRLFDSDGSSFNAILESEGFSPALGNTSSKTILMDLSPQLDELRQGLGGNWKRNLKLVKRTEMEMIEGSTDNLFTLFTDIYQEMVSRKNFVEPNDINQFRSIQSHLPEKFKMKIALCKSGGQVCAGAICSTIGETAVYLFGATSDAGMKSRGSYLLQWSFIEQFKRDGVTSYDLNGVNPVANPGTYTFKNDLAGRSGKEVSHLGRFESKGSLLSHLCVHSGETAREYWREVKRLSRAKRVANLLPRLAR